MNENYDEFTQLEEVEKIDQDELYQHGEFSFQRDEEGCDYYRIKVLVRSGVVRAVCYTNDLEGIETTLRNFNVLFESTEPTTGDPVTYEEAYNWKQDVIKQVKEDPEHNHELTLQKRVDEALEQY